MRRVYNINYCTAKRAQKKETKSYKESQEQKTIKCFLLSKLIFM